jgi:solute carrier family 41
MTIPGQITFVFLIWRLAADHTRLSVIFIILYICAALIQVRLSFFFAKTKDFICIKQVAMLLYIAQWMVAFVWRHERDPDNVCIPYLTAIGDLLGTALLTCVFLLLP